jgi:hypothetical protein
MQINMILAVSRTQLFQSKTWENLYGMTLYSKIVWRHFANLLSQKSTQIQRTMSTIRDRINALSSSQIRHPLGIYRAVVSCRTRGAAVSRFLPAVQLTLHIPSVSFSPFYFYSSTVVVFTRAEHIPVHKWANGVCEKMSNPRMNKSNLARSRKLMYSHFVALYMASHFLLLCCSNILSVSKYIKKGHQKEMC